MDQVLIAIFGVQNHLSTAQESARAVLIFFYGLLLLRLAGPRMFGHWSALDIAMTIMVGSALARAMTGSSPLIGTMAAAAVMAVLHVVIAHCVARNRRLAHFVEGRAVTLVDHGRIDEEARKRQKISESDFNEALRQEGIDGMAHIANVKSMTLEPSGKISVVKHEPCKPDLT
ncbi:MAG: DUF421 domain-containing protein [Alphaproteobacteria bacterium]|nr:DUF421 domain-containing protein [Alphaproteobacteria bacterium]